MNRLKTVVDTNILLSDGTLLKNLPDQDVVIPFVVLQELDKFKTELGEIGVNARESIRFLSDLLKVGNLYEGVTLGSTRYFVVNLDNAGDLSPDDFIIGTAQVILQKGLAVRLLSNDLNVRIKASAHGIEALGHDKSNLLNSLSSIYSGLREIEVPTEVINELYSLGEINNNYELLENQYIHLRSEISRQQSAIGVCEGSKIYRVVAEKDVFGIKPRNLEQVCAMDAILNRETPLVSLMGRAGGGKSLLALACALELVVQRKEYRGIVVIRPPIDMGKGVGFTPGSLREKMEVWSGAILDNFEVLIQNNGKANLDIMLDNGTINILPPTHMRGRSLGKTIVIMDEAQNLTRHELKTIVTRMGEDSKLIVTGDIYQIDNPRISGYDNGLTHMVEVFKGHELASHITMTKCERSTLSAVAAELM